MPLSPRVPTPIHPTLIFSLAPRAAITAGPAAMAAAFRKLRRFSSSDIRPPNPMIPMGMITKNAGRKRGGSATIARRGKWSLISGIMDGRPMDESIVKWVKRSDPGQPDHGARRSADDHETRVHQRLLAIAENHRLSQQPWPEQGKDTARHLRIRRGPAEDLRVS